MMIFLRYIMTKVFFSLFFFSLKAEIKKAEARIQEFSVDNNNNNNNQTISKF